MLMQATAPIAAPPTNRESLAHEAARDLSLRFGFPLDPVRLALFWLALVEGVDKGGGDAGAVALLCVGWRADEWTQLLDVAQSETMRSWIVHRLHANSLGCPLELLQSVAQQVSVRRHWNRYLGIMAVDLCEQLAAHGIRVRILKGAPLSALLYGEMSLRDVRDIDLLVDESQLVATANALHAMGFKCQVDLHWLGTTHFRRNLREISFHKLGGAIEIDLHWHINNGWVGEKFNLASDDNGPITEISLGDRAIRWFSIDHALALSDANIINAHHVEMKASVDRLRLAAYVAKTAGNLDFDVGARESGFSTTQDIVAKTQQVVETMARIAHLSPSATARDLFGNVAAQTSKSGFVSLWARHLRRTRSASQLIALLSAAASPALKDYMRAENFNATALFARSIVRKIRG
jgi:Uncharacterised nucleotidyltransferase